MAKRTRTGDLSHLNVEALEEGISRRSCHVKPPLQKVRNGKCDESKLGQLMGAEHFFWQLNCSSYDAASDQLAGRVVEYVASCHSVCHARSAAGLDNGKHVSPSSRP